MALFNAQEQSERLWDFLHNEETQWRIQEILNAQLRNLEREREGFETDAAFIADWTRWVAEREQGKWPDDTPAEWSINPKRNEYYALHRGSPTGITPYREDTEW